MPRQLLGTAIAANTITTTQLQTTVVNQISAGGGPRVSSLIYPGNDTAGNTVGGQTVYINGSGFETNNSIYINGNAVPSKSFISASNLSFTTPALAAGIYPVYVINTDNGATAIFIPGYISSAEPTWVTSAGSLAGSQDELTAWSYSLSTTGDAPITYALAAGSSLPSGISLAANGVISGTLSSPSGNTTTYTFSVTATDAQNQDATRQFTVTTSTGEGVLFANNVLLIHADGTNNGNNHSFLDSSNNNLTITRNGNASQGSFSPFSQTGWSAFFDGTGDYLSLSTNANLNFGTGDFTVELWVMFASVSSDMAFLGSSQPGGYDILYRTSTGLNIGRINTAFDNTFAWSPVANRWYHIAYSRSGTSLKVFVDGTQVGSTATNSISYDSSGSVIIGGSTTNDRLMNGYISNMRLVKGTAVYTSNFTPSTTPFTSIANTSLLTCQSNRFIDNSNNAFTITRNGDVSVQAFAPFAPTAAYTTANVGGSAYFDGTGDYLAMPDNNALEPENSDLTWEMWIKTTSSTQYATLYSRTPSPFNTGMWSLMINEASSTAGDIALYMHEYSPSTYLFRTTGVNIRDNAWHHIAVVRSGSSWVCYVDGVSRATATWSGTTSNIASGPYIGADQNYGRNFIGYISGLRIVKGTAVYTAAFTPPTTPPTNVANTSLLCNFTNAGIFDQTAKNVLETVGDAKVSTAQYKYGTGSMYFDGSGDYLANPTDPLYLFGTGDFTAECWVYPTALNTYNMIFGYSSPNQYWAIRNTGHIHFYDGTSAFEASTNAISTNTWTHIAISRQGTTLRQFVNGVQAISSTCGTTIGSASGANIWFGASAAYVSQHFFTGYIDDLRITKGYARYTSNFTAPTSALKDK